MSKWFVSLMETSGHYHNYQITVTLVDINNLSVYQYQYQYQYQFMDNSTKSYIVQPVLIIRKGCLKCMRNDFSLLISLLQSEDKAHINIFQ